MSFDSLENIIAISDYNQEYTERLYRDKFLSKNKHGHLFDRDRKCICGITEKEYIMTRPKSACVIQSLNLEEVKDYIYLENL